MNKKSQHGHKIKNIVPPSGLGKYSIIWPNKTCDSSSLNHDRVAQNYRSVETHCNKKIIEYRRMR